MRIVELIIDEKEDLSGVEAISVVEFPAIEENFIALNQQLQLAKVDDEKRILMGAALIPNKNIYRRNGEDEYYIFFSDATVKKASELFLMNSNQNNAGLINFCTCTNKVKVLIDFKVGVSYSNRRNEIFVRTIENIIYDK